MVSFRSTVGIGSRLHVLVEEFITIFRISSSASKVNSDIWTGQNGSGYEVVMSESDAVLDRRFSTLFLKKSPNASGNRALSMLDGKMKLSKMKLF